MKQKLTSRFPLIVRALALVVWGLPIWIAIWYFVPSSVLLEWRWAVIGFAVYQLAFLCILLALMKDVWIDENNIYLATLFRKSQAPLEAITSITEDSRGRIRQIKLTLAQPNDIGEKLTFTPYHSFAFFKSHPVTEEINRLLQSRSQQLKRYSDGLHFTLGQ